MTCPYKVFRCSKMKIDSMKNIEYLPKTPIITPTTGFLSSSEFTNRPEKHKKKICSSVELEKYSLIYCWFKRIDLHIMTTLELNFH